MTRMLLLALLAGACAGAREPAPISYGGSAHGPPANADAAGEAPAFRDAPLSAYALRPEAAQPFDPARPPRTHRVAANESLYDIASTYQVPLRALIEQNHLAPPFTLTPGRELELPPPRFHDVARGESFEDVARGYNVDLRSLALLNRMRPPYDVAVGARIVLPALARAYGPPASVDDAGGAPAVHDSAVRLSWPLRGQIVARFGMQPSGARLDGVEIAARAGEAIAAAADGEVVYAGSDLPAYGALVLVRHADSVVTAYGYARRILVREGQHVRAGEPIAEAGAPSDGRPRLLFQVRRGRDAVDPLPLLEN